IHGENGSRQRRSRATELLLTAEPGYEGTAVGGAQDHRQADAKPRRHFEGRNRAWCWSGHAPSLDQRQPSSRTRACESKNAANETSEVSRRRLVHAAGSMSPKG